MSIVHYSSWLIYSIQTIARYILRSRDILAIGSDYDRKPTDFHKVNISAGSGLRKAADPDKLALVKNLAVP